MVTAIRLFSGENVEPGVVAVMRSAAEKVGGLVVVVATRLGAGHEGRPGEVAAMRLASNKEGGRGMVVAAMRLVAGQKGSLVWRRS